VQTSRWGAKFPHTNSNPNGGTFPLAMKRSSPVAKRNSHPRSCQSTPPAPTGGTKTESPADGRALNDDSTQLSTMTRLTTRAEGVGFEPTMSLHS
jgi:hypothetical protein